MSRTGGERLKRLLRTPATREKFALAFLTCMSERLRQTRACFGTQRRHQHGSGVVEGMVANVRRKPMEYWLQRLSLGELRMKPLQHRRLSRRSRHQTRRTGVYVDRWAAHPLRRTADRAESATGISVRTGPRPARCKVFDQS